MKKKILCLILFLSIVFTAYAIQTFKLAPLTYSVVSTATDVGTSATPIPATSLVGRNVIAIRLNDTTESVWIGNANVTVNNGFLLNSSISSITVDINDKVIIYGICSAGTVEVRSIEAK